MAKSQPFAPKKASASQAMTILQAEGRDEDVQSSAGLTPWLSVDISSESYVTTLNQKKLRSGGYI